MGVTMPRTWYADGGTRTCPECGALSNEVTAYSAPDPDGLHRRYMNGWRCPNGHEWETPTLIHHLIDRRAFLRSIVPAAAGIAIAPAAALEALERRRYWPGFGAGRPVSAVEHIDAILREPFVMENIVETVNQSTAFMAQYAQLHASGPGRPLIFPITFAEAL